MRLKRKPKFWTKPDGGSYSCTTTDISSDNNSGTKILIKYENDETLDVKEEITQDQEIFSKTNMRLKRKPKFWTKPDGGSYSCTTTDISSDNNCGTKILIKYENDETLDVKEEITQVSDQKTKETTRQELNKNCVSELCTFDIRKGDICSVKKKLRSQENQKIQELMEKKYKCEKCARIYKHKYTLTYHQKFECGVMRQFSCKFCGKRFKRQNYMHRHVNLVHLKTNLQTSRTKHNCDKCSRSYGSLGGLNRHKRLDHAAVIPQFICNYCSYTTKLKSHLSDHISSRHLK